MSSLIHCISLAAAAVVFETCPATDKNHKHGDCTTGEEISHCSCFLQLRFDELAARCLFLIVPRFLFLEATLALQPPLHDAIGLGVVQHTHSVHAGFDDGEVGLIEV